MTQSGQGEEPSQRVAREGIVLPSDGGEPLLPGMTGGSAGRPVPAQAPPPPPPTPTGGQAWGQPWGPDMNQHQGQSQGPYEGQSQGRHQGPYEGQPQGQNQVHSQGRHQGQPQAQGQAQGQAQAPAAEGWPATPDAQPHQQWGAQGQFQPQSQPQSPQQQPEQQAPSAPAWNNDPRATGDWSQQPGYGAQPTPGAPLPVPHAPQGAGSAPLPPATGGTPMPQHQEQPYGQGQHPGAYGPYGGAPLPPEGGAAVPYAAAPGAPLPPADEGATQYIPPVPGTPGPVVDQATQYLPPVAAHAPAHANEAATQFLPPVGPGALPPETNAEATTFLGRVPQAAPAHPDAQATQYIPPVPAGPYGAPDDRQPPSAFDNLFRGGPAADAPAGATQQLPRVQPQQPGPPAYAQQPSYGFPNAAPHAPHDLDDRHDGRGGGRRSRVPVIAALGIGIAVLGVGAGALLSGGGGGSDDDAGNKTVAATSAAPEESGSPAADPAKAQAVELDKLLATSNNSRDAVIKAVADVKSCDNLGQAATDLRDAAQQRGELVTRLSSLPVDKLPNHAALTESLTKAWQASQSADNHYAAWADQVARKNGCKKGQARTTSQTQNGNKQSGIATTQKAQAAELWNAIAKSYGLTERQSTQL
ncbi:hypothetical protein ACFYXF_22870 [Streptomyces sp. NPDC002680]|uniref:hypothetical protein n=1 Tax=Streptomyces sp. NPDC002680 TaxID=3364659 RepID=UPI00369467F9